MRICWSLGLTCTCIGLVAFSVRAAEDDTKKVLFNEDGERCAYHTLEEYPRATREVRSVDGEGASLLPEGKRFRLVWNDEFNGTALDETKWGYRTNFWGRPAHWFAKPEDGCVEVKDGRLHLRVKKLANGQFVSPQLQTGAVMWDTPPMDNPSGFWWMGKREPPKFRHGYGYYECRARLQQKSGWWSAFWMQSEQQGGTLDPSISGIEHDIMESFSPGEILPSCFHYNGYGPDYTSFRIPDCPRDELSFLKLDETQYHVFGFLWEPDGYTLYVDGRLRGKGGKDVSRIPQFILLSTECKWYRNNRMTGKGVPALEAAAAANDEFIVDWVRVYDVVK